MTRNDLLKSHVIVEFVNNEFKCEEPCDEWLEIKHKSDKTANGLFYFYFLFTFTQ